MAAAYYDKMDVATMSKFSAALRDLLNRDGNTLPGTDDDVHLIEAIAASAWLRFGVGIAVSEPAPAGRVEEVSAAAADFNAAWDLWAAYRTCVIELSPPGGAKVKFRIDPSLGGKPPDEFPAATFAVITAWNPGSGEPRPNEKANRRANERLAAHLDARMVERWPAMNAPGSRWREESFCVLGIDLDEAWRIGEAFQQRAIYYVESGRPYLVSRRRGKVVTWEGELRLVR
jgi:hypothetical protein